MRPTFIKMFFLLSLTWQFTKADISDFIIRNENDLKRFGDTNDELITDDDMYSEDSEYFGDMYADEGGSCGAMGSSGEMSGGMLLRDAMKSGQINADMFREVMKQLAQDPRYASLIENAQQYADFQKLGESSSCGAEDQLEAFYNTNEYQPYLNMF